MGNEVKDKIVAALDRLRNEHRAIDEQIRTLEGRRYITVSEELEIKRLKRMKLAKKDEIAMVVMTSGRR